MTTNAPNEPKPEPLAAPLTLNAVADDIRSETNDAGEAVALGEALAALFDRSARRFSAGHRARAPSHTS